jgi:hypothetical protein
LLRYGYFPDVILYNQSGETAMTERFNIIIAKDNGDIRTFSIPRRRLLLSTVFGALVLAVLAFTGFFTAGLSAHNTYLVHKMAAINKDMESTKRINDNFEARLAKILEENKNEVAQLKAKNEQLVTTLQLKSSHLIADLKMQNLKQEAAFKEEKAQLMSTAVSQLHERSELIANVMSNIGVKLKKMKNTDSSKTAAVRLSRSKITASTSSSTRLINIWKHFDRCLWAHQPPAPPVLHTALAWTRSLIRLPFIPASISSEIQEMRSVRQRKERYFLLETMGDMATTSL